MIIIPFIVFLFYLYFCAYEDWKTCLVKRWKHLIGFSSAILMIIINHNLDFKTFVFLILYMLFYFLLGIFKVYGLADAFIFMNMTLFLGSIFGTYSIFITIIVQVFACALSLLTRLVRKIIKKRTNLSYIPYIAIIFTILSTLFIIGGLNYV